MYNTTTLLEKHSSIKCTQTKPISLHLTVFLGYVRCRETSDVLGFHWEGCAVPQENFATFGIFFVRERSGGAFDVFLGGDENFQKYPIMRFVELGCLIY